MSDLLKDIQKANDIKNILPESMANWLRKSEILSFSLSVRPAATSPLIWELWS